ncbi:hypothetical protein NMG60_11005270 [Bertholletia excelsa]
MAENMMFSFLLVSDLVILLLVASPTSAMTCADAIDYVRPCAGFFIGGAPVPGDECCSGAKTLNQIAAASEEDRKTACECLKQAAKRVKIDLGKAKMLPQICNFTPVIPIDPDVDCSSR